MGGWVTVMEPSDYAAWLFRLTGGSVNPVVAGEKLFADKACATCHVADGTGRAPSLNAFLAQSSFGGWFHRVADEAYSRESICNQLRKL